MPEFAFIKEGSRGKDGADLCGSNGAGQPFYTGSVVHHCRDTPTGNSAKNHRRADARVRQHQANLFTFFAVFFQNTRHKQRFGQQLAIAIRLEVDVFHTRFFLAIAVHGGQ